MRLKQGVKARRGRRAYCGCGFRRETGERDIGNGLQLPYWKTAPSTGCNSTPTFSRPAWLTFRKQRLAAAFQACSKPAASIAGDSTSEPRAVKVVDVGILLICGLVVREAEAATLSC